ncbi:pyridoxal phosphate-dependent aminotransferase [Flavitalea sp.]|nr:histidinol-phosphate transaminase [Flavitalea sp.]
MAAPMNRRNWLKASTLLTGGLAFAPATWNKLEASPANNFTTRERSVSDAEILADAPVLKARLSANENPFGPSEKAKIAITGAMAASYQYGFMGNRLLAQKIAINEKVENNMVLLGAGSTPILQATAIHFSREGGNIVTGDPSYADLPEHATNFNTKWIKVPLTADYKLDLDEMEKTIDVNTRLVCICNPNNPTGTVLETEKLKSFCERVSKKVPVFVDEAYIDYLPDPQASTVLDLVRAGNNIIVARTFSKLYGFAGLRVGYAIAPKSILAKLELYNSDGSLSHLSVQAALVAYEDKEYLRSALEKTLASREYLYSVLKAEGYDYIPSSANFVMFPIKMDGRRFSEEMMKRSVSIRYWKFNDKNWCRVSIGTMDEMKAFAEAFKQIS